MKTKKQIADYLLAHYKWATENPGSLEFYSEVLYQLTKNLGIPLIHAYINLGILTQKTNNDADNNYTLLSYEIDSDDYYPEKAYFIIDDTLGQYLGEDIINYHYIHTQDAELVLIEFQY